MSEGMPDMSNQDEIERLRDALSEVRRIIIDTECEWDDVQEILTIIHKAMGKPDNE